MFDFLKARLSYDKNLKFNNVTEEDILTAELKMGFPFPNSLRVFYREIGYGFFKASPAFINRIMEPADIADFMCEADEYAHVDRDVYPEDELVFMHISGDDFLTIEYSGRKEGAVKYFGDIIAPSFADFISRMAENPGYFV